MEENAVEIEASLIEIRALARESGLEAAATRLNGVIQVLREEAASQQSKVAESSE